ncbi:hypothetical protein SAMN05421866_3947 [Chryseobacterium oranimense]|jgi:hypothetical protein|uniref:Uncharacterized protein n=1 Tax=Chryseobacterium oranimense TaxID=421058 RepID=A0A1M5W7H4_9FLAO|nr:hypothetical protein SAMN05421866_3947 [Chryseobacterium oranimense]
MEGSSCSHLQRTVLVMQDALQDKFVLLALARIAAA